ncbi:DUF423 domain-containing protein [uncultured Roseibium sp.]|uniref:DUF423 domain-containing protein n=1 Tax=uncultured Roseibium sp. TaxID=1936171 RepID=UPI002634E2F6|nr:DUF423 domain-containing protein [uncultured Roseibium sp.]
MRERSLFRDGGPTKFLLRLCLVFSGIAGGLGVACLALAAHAEAVSMPAKSSLLQTAAQMLLAHAPIILGAGILTQIRRAPLLPLAVALMAIGLSLFCGDLVLRVFMEQKMFHMAAPIGGMSLLFGWLVLALSALRVQPN